MPLLSLIEMKEKNNDIADGTEDLSEPGKQLDNHQDSNAAFLSRSEISLLSKGLKFVPSANKIDQAKLKRELEEYGRNLHLMWHFRNDERTFSTDKFRPKSFFKPSNKDTIIKTYLSYLEERLLDIKIPSKRYNNLIKEERDASYSLRDDSHYYYKGC